MNYTLFIGSKLGYEAIKIMSKYNCKVNHVFIEKDHNHESEKFYQLSIAECIASGFDYTLDSKYNDIYDLINDDKSIDYIMSFGYRKMIPETILEQSKYASVGTHFSPLPRYRGFAPLNWLLINGETETAVNIFHLEKEVDNGDIIIQKKVEINYQDDINSLFDKCLITFKELMINMIPKFEEGKFNSYKQDEMGATYTCSRNPSDGLIDWKLSSREIYNLVRALTYPYPGAYAFLNGKKILIWSSEEYLIPKYEGVIAGKVIKIIKDIGVVVLCGTGAILLKNVQYESEDITTADKLIKSVRVNLVSK